MGFYPLDRSVADPQSVAEAAREDLSARRVARTRVEQRIAAGRKAYQEEAAPMLRSEAVPIRPEQLMGELDAILTPDCIFVSDASYSAVWGANFLTSKQPGMRFLAGRGLAGLGWGLPAAIGAKIAAPEREVFCLTGDGGFAHVWSELETAKRMGVRLVVIVLNNQILGYQSHAEDVMYGDHTDACELFPVDHAAIARACGCEGERIEEPSQFGPALERARRSPVTTVIDVMIDPKAYPPMTLYEGRIKF